MDDTVDTSLGLRPIGVEVADRLEAAIVRETFAPGEKLREVDICTRFGVSRSPLREAFQILEARGLVERRPRLGTRVTEMTVEVLDEITTCRLALECTCSRLLAEREDHAEIADALDQVLAEMRKARAQRDFRSGFEANVRLTALMHKQCGNSVLMRLLDQLDTSALRYRFRAYLRTTGMLDDMIEGNRALIAEIRNGQGQRAAEMTDRLIRSAWQTTRDLFLSTSESTKT